MMFSKNTFVTAWCLACDSMAWCGSPLLFLIHKTHQFSNTILTMVAAPTPNKLAVGIKYLMQTWSTAYWIWMTFLPYQWWPGKIEESWWCLKWTIGLTEFGSDIKFGLKNMGSVFLWEGTDTSRKNINKSSDSKILFGGETFFQIDEGGEEAQVGIDRASALHLQSVTIYKSQWCVDDMSRMTWTMASSRVRLVFCMRKARVIVDDRDLPEKSPLSSAWSPSQYSVLSASSAQAATQIMIISVTTTISVTFPEVDDNLTHYHHYRDHHNR